MKTMHDLRGGKLRLEMQVCGEGEPLLFLHGAGGLQDDDPFIRAMGEHLKVFAPHLPGYGSSSGEEFIDDVFDAALMLHQLMDELGIESANIMGHSMGGMLASELVALDVHRAKKLVLVSSVGLWLDETPIPDFFAMEPEELKAVLFHDPASPLAEEFFRVPDDVNQAAEAYLERMKRLTAAGKFLWPIPDRGFARRAYRVTVPTLLIWGESDRLVPPAYARAFQERLADTRLALIPQAGHLPMYERPREFMEALLGFLMS